MLGDFSPERSLTILLDLAEMIVFHPIQHKLVWCQQSKSVWGFDGLKWSDPGIKLLRGEFTFKTIHALVPKTHRNTLDYLIVKLKILLFNCSRIAHGAILVSVSLLPAD